LPLIISKLLTGTKKAPDDTLDDMFWIHNRILRMSFDDLQLAMVIKNTYNVYGDTYNSHTDTVKNLLTESCSSKIIILGD